jgi:hypothetical protein
MEWVEGPGRPDKKRASRALRWLEEEGFVTSERTGRSKCYEVVARSPRSASTPDLLPSVSGTETNGARAKVFGEPSAGHADEDISKPSVDEFECLQRGDLDWGDGRDGLGERELDARLEREL